VSVDSLEKLVSGRLSSILPPPLGFKYFLTIDEGRNGVKPGGSLAGTRSYNGPRGYGFGWVRGGGMVLRAGSFAHG
jgi:hypothetical protein